MHVLAEEHRTKRKRIRRSLSWQSIDRDPTKRPYSKVEKVIRRSFRYVAFVLCCFAVSFNSWRYLSYLVDKDEAKALPQGDLTLVTFAGDNAHANTTEASRVILLRESLKSCLRIFAAHRVLVLGTSPSTCRLARNVHPNIRCILLEKQLIRTKDLIAQILHHVITDFVVFSNAPGSLPKQLKSELAGVSGLLKHFVLFRRHAEYVALVEGIKGSARDKQSITPLNYLAFPSRNLEAAIRSGHAYSDCDLGWGLLLSLLSAPGTKAVEVPPVTRTSRRQNVDARPTETAIANRLLVLYNSSWAHYKVEGSCPNCRLVKNEMLDAVGLAARLADSRGIIGVTSLQYQQVDSFLNWFCWATSNGISNFFVIAEDTRSFGFLQNMGISTILVPGAPVRIMRLHAQQKSWLQVTNFKGAAVSSIVEAGFHVVHFRPETVWLQDPLPSIEHDCTLMTVAQQGSKHLGDLLFIRSGAAGLSFWHKFTTCVQKGIASFPRDSALASGYSEVEDMCLGQVLLSQRTGQQSRTLVCKFLDDFAASYDSFFLKRTHQKRGTWPRLLQYKKGAPPNVDLLMQQHGMWLSQEGNCLQSATPSRPQRTQPGYHLIIRVLTFSRGNALRRLLNSLANADYKDREDVKLTLQVSIDHPGEDAGRALRRSHAEVMDIAKHFQWKHGNYTVIHQPSPLGLLTQWIGSWSPESEEEIMLVLEDDTEVSPLYFQILSRMIEKYYFDPLNFDPRMYGFGLQKQETVVGREQAAVPAKSISKILGREALFKYQLVCTWGAVFFPEHWKEFIRWFVKHRKEKNFDPCLPNTASTLWYNTKGKSSRMWSIWFIRFAFEKGWYNLYLNLPDGSALVTNHREGGLNFKEHRGPSNSMTLNASLIGMELPPTEEIPVYDYFFNKIDSPGALENRMQQYAGLSRSEMCEPGKIYD